MLLTLYGLFAPNCTHIVAPMIEFISDRYSMPGPKFGGEQWSRGLEFGFPGPKFSLDQILRNISYLSNSKTKPVLLNY